MLVIRLISVFAIIFCISLATVQTQAITITERTIQAKQIKIEQKKVSHEAFSFPSYTSLMPSTTEWKHDYDLNGQTGTPSSIINTTDGGYLISGLVYYDQDSYIFLIKTDSSGVAVWAQIYGDLNIQFRAKGVQQTSDNGYIIVGSYGVTGGTSSEVFLLKLDSLGDLEWLQSYQEGESISLYGSDVKQYSGGGYIIVGSRHVYGDSKMRFVVFRTDADGFPLWYTYDDSSWGLFNGKVLIERNTGNIVACNGGTESNTAIYLYKYNPSGSLLTKKLIYSIYCPSSICQTMDNGFILAGNGFDGYSKDPIILMKLNNSFNTVWNSQYSTGGYYGYSGYAEETSDGGYLLTAHSIFYPSPYNRDMFLIKMTVNGSLEWSRRYDFTSEDTPIYCHYTSDGGYIIGGYSPSVFLMKVK